MKRKKFLALALAGVITAATLTACTPLDAAELVYDSIFGGGSSSTSSGTGSAAEEAENRAVAEGAAAYLKSRHQITEVSYGVPELTSTIQPAFTPNWFRKGWKGDISGLNRDVPINPSLKLDDFLSKSLKAYMEQPGNYVGFYAFESTGKSASEQAEQFENIDRIPKVGVQLPVGSSTTKLRVGVCHKTVEGRKYCLAVVVRE